MRSVKRVSLELESGSPGSLGERGDATVISERTAIEADLINTGGLGPFGNRLPHRLGGLLVATEAKPISEDLVHRTGRRERPASRIVDDLGVDVLVRAEHGEPRPIRGAANRATNPETATLSLAENTARMIHR